MKSYLGVDLEELRLRLENIMIISSNDNTCVFS